MVVSALKITRLLNIATIFSGFTTSCDSLSVRTQMITAISTSNEDEIHLFILFFLSSSPPAQVVNASIPQALIFPARNTLSVTLFFQFHKSFPFNDIQDRS